MPDTTPTPTHKIIHPGRVVDVFPGSVDVSIIAESACVSCKMKKACGMDESKEKIVTVFTPDADAFEPGQSVEVVMRQAMGYKAIGIVYILPVLVVMAVLVGSVQGGLSEILSGLISLGFLALYYFIVYLLRERISREIRFEIRIPKNSQP